MEEEQPVDQSASSSNAAPQIKTTFYQGGGKSAGWQLAPLNEGGTVQTDAQFEHQPIEKLDKETIDRIAAGEVRT